MNLSYLLQHKTKIAAFLGIGAVISLTAVVGKGVLDYASLYTQNTPPTEVLGEKTNASQCLSSEVFQQFLQQTQKTVTLYAPNKSVTFSLDSLASCFQGTGCDSAEFSCKEGKVSLNQQCVSEYFAKNSVGVEEKKIVSGAGAVAQVAVEDWSVNYENLAEQLSKAVTEEIKYCQIEGKEEQTRQNIGGIQLAVADEQPGMSGTDFTSRFLEIDISKGKAYYWSNGTYQTMQVVHGARFPQQGIYHLKDVSLNKYLTVSDATFVTQNGEQTDYVIIHQ